MWNSIKDLGFVDSWRVQNPDDGTTYSWFDYRSRMFDQDPKKGLRIDHFLVTDKLCKKIKNVEIDKFTRGLERPSDHAPIRITF